MRPGSPCASWEREGKSSALHFFHKLETTSGTKTSEKTYHRMPQQKYRYIPTPFDPSPLFNSPLNILKLFLPTSLRVLLPSPILLLLYRQPKPTLIKCEYCYATLGKGCMDLGVPRDVFIEAVDGYKKGFGG